MDAGVQQIIGSGRAGDRCLTAPRRATPGDWTDAFDRRVLLARAVELDIVPRLVLPGRTARAVGHPDAPDALGASDIEEFAALVLGDNPDHALAYAGALRARGLGLAAICLDLLAPTARHLGDLWCEDLCDFTQVTIGVGQLHRILREVTPAFPGSPVPALADHHALLVPAPGEQHTFGLAMVTEFFRRAAWTVWSGVPALGDELATIVRDHWFGVIGFSLGSETRLEALRTGIRTVRRTSRNRSIGIMVGGPLFIEHPELVAQVGADATAVDGRQAVGQAQRLLVLPPVRV